jgi:hypothetical protein
MGRRAANSVFRVLTPSEQRLEHLRSLKRPLTDAESDDLRKAMHAVYEYQRRLGFIEMARAEELDLLKKVQAEYRACELAALKLV